MASLASNKPGCVSYRALLSAGLTVFCALFLTPAASQAATTAKKADTAVSTPTTTNTASSSEVADRINKAIKEAEAKLGANPVVEEVRKDIQTNLKPAGSSSASASNSPGLQTTGTAPSTSAAVSANQAAVWPVAHSDSAPTGSQAFKFKSADPAKQASELARQANSTYARREDYNAAYELTHEALRIDPQNRAARDVRKRIEHDMRDHPMDLAGTDRILTAPEGKIALAVALSDNRVTLQEAEEIAVKNSLMLESLRHRAAGARHKVNEAIRAFLPTLNLDISFGGGAVASGGFEQRPYDSEKYLASFSQPLYYGGELIFTLRQAQASLRADELRYQKERTDVVRQVGEAYRGAVSAVHNVNYQHELFRRIREYKTRQDKAFESRLIPEIDHLEIASIYNQVAFQKEAAVTTQKAANLTLCQAIGVPADQPIPVDPSVEIDRMTGVDLEEYLNRVGIGNYDIRIRQTALESAYYGAKVYDAQKKVRVDLRGNVGVAGELSYINPEPFGGESANWVSAGRPDLEKEYSLIVEAKVPFGPNTLGYTNQRRTFAPSVSSFQGSDDYKHSVTMGVLDRLANRTDEEVAKAEYLKAMAELQKEKTDQEIAARQAYYDYEGALLQLETSDAKILFRERQVKILEQTTQMEEARLTELLNEMVNLAEDRFSRITAISDANNALAKMNYLAGTEGINNPHEIQSASK